MKCIQKDCVLQSKISCFIRRELNGLSPLYKFQSQVTFMNVVGVVVNVLVLASVLLKYVTYKIKVDKTSKKRSLLLYELCSNRFGIKNCFSFDFSTDRFIDPSNGESHKKDESCLTLTLTQCYARLHLSRNVFSLIIHFRVYPSNRLNLKNVLDIPF